MLENLLSVNQAAFILKVHPLTIRRYIREGKLKAVKAGGNIRIKESSLSEFNKDFTLTPKEPTVKSKFVPSKRFMLDVPLFRLRGRGASLTLSS